MRRGNGSARTESFSGDGPNFQKQRANCLKINEQGTKCCVKIIRTITKAPIAAPLTPVAAPLTPVAAPPVGAVVLSGPAAGTVALCADAV